MPDNVEDWQVFQDDKILQFFLENARNFNEDDSSNHQEDHP